MDYIAIIHKDPDSDYGVSLPDFPGCITAGITVDEAKEMAIEALTFHIEGMIEDGEKIPAPSSLEEIMKDPDFRDGLAFLVNVPSPDKTIRFNVTAPESALRRIDAAASERGMSRSAFLVRAAEAAARENPARS
jgi:predicted RNase H-like HicB family nuclease